MACLCAWAAWKAKQQNLCLAVAAEDDDMKIAGDSFSSGPSPDEAAEAAAEEFLRQKEIGNIEKARRVGKKLADPMFDTSQGPLCGIHERAPREVHHQFLLYSYVVNRVIAEESPNSILAQTALNVFYAEIEAASPVLHEIVCDTAAFSLYILRERTEREQTEVGHIYAGLCARAQQPESINDGNRLYREAYEYCRQVLRSAGYRQ